MPRVKVKRNEIHIAPEHTLIIMSAICIILMIVTYTTDVVSIPLSYISGYTIVPFENGINYVSSYVREQTDNLKQLKSVLEQNEALSKELDSLKIENSNLIKDKYELNELRSLLELSKKYEEYDTTGAHVIGKDPGNWFSVFVIDKGLNDGITKDMNVMAGSGLVGIVTYAGPNWSTVRSIIDDSSNVSAQVLSTSDLMMVTGDLLMMEDGCIRFSQLKDDEGLVSAGDKVVTSSISDKFLPGINIGYISQIEDDSNNLTKSGTITPVVDFEHLEVVLVIKKLKENNTKNN